MVYFCIDYKLDFLVSVSGSVVKTPNRTPVDSENQPKVVHFIGKYQCYFLLKI